MFTTKVRSKKESSCHDARKSVAPDVRSCSTAARRIRAVVGSERGRHESGRTHAERRITTATLLRARGAGLAARRRGGSCVTTPRTCGAVSVFFSPIWRHAAPGATRASAAALRTLPVAYCVPPCPRHPSRPTHHRLEPACPSPAQTAPATSPSPCAHRSEAEVSARAPSFCTSRPSGIDHGRPGLQAAEHAAGEQGSARPYPRSGQCRQDAMLIVRPGGSSLYVGVRVPASCVASVPEAQGSSPRRATTVRAPYAYQPRAYRAYCVPYQGVPVPARAHPHPSYVAPQVRRRSCTSCRWGRW